MGTCGTGTFDDDVASDWLTELLANPRASFLRETLMVDDQGYLELDDGAAVLGAAEVISGVLDGPRDGLPDEAYAAIAALTKDDVRGLKALAAKRVRRVLREQSELREVWEENAEDYPVWRRAVLELAERLAD